MNRAMHGGDIQLYLDIRHRAVVLRGCKVVGIQGRPNFSRFDPRPEAPHFSNTLGLGPLTDGD